MTEARNVRIPKAIAALGIEGCQPDYADLTVRDAATNKIYNVFFFEGCGMKVAENTTFKVRDSLRALFGEKEVTESFTAAHLRHHNDDHSGTPTLMGYTRDAEDGLQAVLQCCLLDEEGIFVGYATTLKEALDKGPDEADYPRDEVPA